MQRTGLCRNLGLWGTGGIQTGKRPSGLLVPHPLGPSGWEAGWSPWENEVQTNSSSERESSTAWGSHTGLGGAVLSYPLSSSPWGVPASDHVPGIRASKWEGPARTPSACLRPSLERSPLGLDARKSCPGWPPGTKRPLSPAPARQGPQPGRPSAGTPLPCVPTPPSIPTHPGGRPPGTKWRGHRAQRRAAGCQRPGPG